MVNGLLPAISATTYGLLPASTIFDMKEPRAEYHVMFSLMRSILHAFVKVCERRVEICLTRVVFLEVVVCLWVKQEIHNFHNFAHGIYSWWLLLYWVIPVWLFWETWYVHRRCGLPGPNPMSGYIHRHSPYLRYSSWTGTNQDATALFRKQGTVNICDFSYDCFRNCSWSGFRPINIITETEEVIHIHPVHLFLFCLPAYGTEQP